MPTIEEQYFDGVRIEETNFYPCPPDVSMYRYTGSGASQGWIYFYSNSNASERCFISALNFSNPTSGYLYTHTLVFSRHPNAEVVYHRPTGNTNITLTDTFTYEEGGVRQTAYYRLLSGNVSSNNRELLDVIPAEYGIVTDINEVAGRIAWLGLYGDYGGEYTISYILTNCTGNSHNPTVISSSAAVTYCYFTPNNKYYFDSSSCEVLGSGVGGNPIQFEFNPNSGYLRIGTVTSNVTVKVTAYIDPYSDVDGDGQLPSDTIIMPNEPTKTITASGIIGLFAPTEAELRSLGDFMWTDFGGSGTDIVTVLKEIEQAIKRSISNPLDYVYGLNIIPCGSQGLNLGSYKLIRFGFIDTDVRMRELASQYFTVNCGELEFPELCNGYFLDYAPYAKMSIYLPYIGVKELNANDFVGNTMRVIYRGDAVTGSVTAFIYKNDTIMYQFSGCCALTIPLSSDSWGNTISAAMQVASSAILAYAGGGPAGVGEGAAKGAASITANPSLLAPQILRSGAVTGGSGNLGVQKPFVIRETVSFHDVEKFNTVAGYPSYYYRSLGANDVHGYTVCYDVHLHISGATYEEIAEIEKLLKEGVII